VLSGAHQMTLTTSALVIAAVVLVAIVAGSLSD
jgi:hypothetical protein